MWRLAAKRRWLKRAAGWRRDGVSPNPPADEAAAPVLPPLLLAVHLGHAAVMAVLLRGGADPEATGLDGCTALLQCAKAGNWEVDPAVLDELLWSDANPNAGGPTGKTSLCWQPRIHASGGCVSCHMPVLTQRWPRATGARPLRRLHGHLAAVEALLAAGARPRPGWQVGYDCKYDDGAEGAQIKELLNQALRANHYV